MGVSFGTCSKFCSGFKTPLPLHNITAIEKMSHRSNQQDTDGLRSEINRNLEGSYPTKCNLSKAENKAIQKLTKGKKDHINSGQVGGYGGHGQTGLFQQSRELSRATNIKIHPHQPHKQIQG